MPSINRPIFQSIFPSFLLKFVPFIFIWSFWTCSLTHSTWLTLQENIFPLTRLALLLQHKNTFQPIRSDLISFLVLNIILGIEFNFYMYLWSKRIKIIFRNIFDNFYSIASNFSNFFPFYFFERFSFSLNGQSKAKILFL